MIKTSILEYIGKYNNGILVSVGLNFDSKYFEGIFYYTKDQVFINVDSKLEELIKCHIEEHPDYILIMEDIIRKVEPFDKTYDSLNEVNWDILF